MVEIESNKVESTLKKLSENKRIAWVQPSGEFNLLNNQSPETVAPSLGYQPIELPISSDGNGIRIALIDSAVDNQHTDIAKAIEHSEDFVSTNISAITSSNNKSGENHGTAIASVLVAKKNSHLGLSGIAPAANLLAYRGCWENTSGQTNCNTLSLARALNAVAKSKPDILNLSLSGPKDLLLDKLIQKIVSNDTLVVAAFDPERPNKSRFPSRQDGVLIVRAETLDTHYKNEFTAPGSRIVASPGNRYNYMSGHSVAAAYTSGVLALLSKAPLSNTQTQTKNNIKRDDFLDKRGNPKFHTVNDLIELISIKTSTQEKETDLIRFTVKQ